MKSSSLTRANTDADGCTVNRSNEGILPEMPAKTITSAELFAARREIVIQHAGKEYRLRITSNSKLILTK